MGKQNVSATVDEDVYEFLQQDHINTSGLINRCLREYMNTGGDVSAVRDLRVQQLLDEADDLENRAKNKRERAEQLQEVVRKSEGIGEEERREQLQRLTSVPNDPDHPLVQEIAHELDMTPEQAIEEATNL